MGEVYRARDLKLKREVAIKILPEEFCRDADRVSRFQREAEVLASLNHPNIAAIYGLEESGGSKFLILELAEGETLADRLRRGVIPLEESLKLALQIADAIDGAHQKGVIHRDLKPANIKVTADGKVKVLDFGLARAFSHDREANASDSPTLSMAATQQGIILGTAAYMSPEQARGEQVDKRADIWAFGVVLFEMVTGKRLFDGKTVSDTLAAVLVKDPDLSQVHVRVRKLLRACLERETNRRLRDIGEVWRFLEDSGGKAADSKPRPVWMPIVVFAILALIAVALALWAPWRVELERPTVRLEVDLGADVSLPSTESTVLSDVVISPDGMRLVYGAQSPGKPRRLFTRRLDQPKAVELAGTTGAIGPCFSPDGQWIGFYAGGKFNKISVEGGAVVPLVDVHGFPGGAAWQDDNNIVLAGAASAGIGAGGLAQIRSDGSHLTKITEVKDELGHAFPQYLPGGKAILFVNYPTLSPDKPSVEVVTLADGHRKTIVPGATSARYLPTYKGSGHLLYTKKGTLFATPFDLSRLETRGSPVPVLDDIAYQSASGNAQFDVSLNGTLVYRRSLNNALATSTIIQFLTPGTGVVGKNELLRNKPGTFRSLRFSLDGTRLALLADEPEETTLWVYDQKRDALTRLAAPKGHYTAPIWSSDDRYIFFGSLSDGMFWTRADGAGEAQSLTQKAFQIPSSITTDGKLLVYQQDLAQIWTLPLEDVNGKLKAGKPAEFLKRQVTDGTPEFSPDGLWLAFTSNVSGSDEVYVRRFPDTGAQWPISNNGGTQPVWSRNGRDLLYRSGDRIMAVSYTVKGDSFNAEKPRVWIEKLGGMEWDLAPDGKSVVVLTPVETNEAVKQDHEVVFLFNFFDDLRRRAPLK
jgi:serine/threonine-protein kinase